MGAYTRTVLGVCIIDSSVQQGVLLGVVWCAIMHIQIGVSCTCTLTVSLLYLRSVALPVSCSAIAISDGACLYVSMCIYTYSMYNVTIQSWLHVAWHGCFIHYSQTLIAGDQSVSSLSFQQLTPSRSHIMQARLCTCTNHSDRHRWTGTFSCGVFIHLWTECGCCNPFECTVIECLGAHVHWGLLYLVCVFACFSASILVLQAMKRQKHNTNRYNATCPGKILWLFS